jgi:hypothetical protein
MRYRRTNGNGCALATPTTKSWRGRIHLGRVSGFAADVRITRLLPVHCQESMIIAAKPNKGSVDLPFTAER